MTYEEKLKILKGGGTVQTKDIEPDEYFKFIRDGAMQTVVYRLLNGHQNLYQICCMKMSKGEQMGKIRYTDIWGDSVEDLNEFFQKMIAEKDYGYLQIENENYKVILDVLETYE